MKRTVIAAVFAVFAAAPEVAVAQGQESVERLWIDLQECLPKRVTGVGRKGINDAPGAATPADWSKTVERMGLVMGRSQGTPVEPYATFYFASFLFNSGEVDAAQALFEALKTQFPAHPLCTAKLAQNGGTMVDQAVEDCKREKAFLERYPRKPTQEPVLNDKRKVVLSFDVGDVEIRFYDNVAPKTVAQFVKHVKEGLYDGTIVGRVEADALLQLGGKETEKGRIVPSDASKGTPPPIPLEINRAAPKLGTVLMMRNLGQPESHGVLFEITLMDYAAKAYQQTVFGEVTKGLDILQAVSRRPRDNFEYPATTVRLKSARVVDG
jgi:cyclophilin family peptidyl-prolyl cis-trans isomerase